MRQGQIHYYTTGLPAEPQPLVVQDNDYYQLRVKLSKLELPNRDCQWRLEFFKQINTKESHWEVYLEREELDQLRNYLNGAG